MKAILCAAAILALASASSIENVLNMENAPVDTGLPARNPVIEQLLLGFIEDFRQTMLTGSDALPVLDPFNLEHLHLELDEILGIEGSHVTVSDLEARQLSTFVIDNLSVSMTSLIQQRYSINVDGHIPNIEVDSAFYDMSVTVMDLHIFGAGSAKLKIIEPRIKANIVARISLVGGISITLESTNIVFQLGGFEPEITGMFDNDFLNDFINAFLKSLIPEMVEFFEVEISEFISDLVMQVANDLIGDFLPLDATTEMGRNLATVLMLPVLQQQEGFEHVFENLD